MDDETVLEDGMWSSGCQAIACILLLPFISSVLAVMLRNVLEMQINEEDVGFLVGLKCILLDVVNTRFILVMVTQYFIALRKALLLSIAISVAHQASILWILSQDLQEFLSTIFALFCVLSIVIVVVRYFIRCLNKTLDENIEDFKRLIYCEEYLWNSVKPVHYACIHNNLSALKWFSRKYQSYNKRDKNKCTPLNICVKLGHVKLLKFIVEELKMRYDYSYIVTLSYQSSSIDIAKSTLQDKLERDHSDIHGNSPLHIACMLGHIHIVEYLTKEIGCDPNRRNKIGMSCISIAVKYKQIGILKILLDNFPCDLNLLDSRGKSPIFLAAENGLLDALKYFRRKLPSGEVFFEQCHMDSIKNNILHAASAHGFVEVVQYCIEELNFDITSTNSDGKSGLHLCVEHGHLEILRYLLDNTESDITLMDGTGKTPMELATDSGIFQIFKCLAQKSIDGNPKVTKTSKKEIFSMRGYEKCLLACAFGLLDTVRYLVEEMLCDTNCTNKQGMSCLHLAAKHGQSEIVQYLIEGASADLAAVDVYSKSPAFIAAETGHLGILKYIVGNNKGCASFKTLKHTLLGTVEYAPGCTLLHAASHGGHIKILEYLIQSCGCDHSCTDDVGIYPLYVACLMEQYEIADFLLDKFRCDPNRRIVNGRTCLHAACSRGSYIIFIKLVNRHGCDHDSADKGGTTPLYISCELGCIAMAKILIEEKECDVTHKRNDGRSYLHAASSSGNLELVQLLVDDFNLEPDCMDNAGTTPLYIASEKGHLEVTKYFVAGKSCEVTKECIFVAESSKNTQVLKFLNDQYSILQNKSDLNYDQNSQSCTYVHQLSGQMGRLDLIRYHVKHHHCIVNSKDDDGKTPLFYACQSGDLDVVKYLISQQNCDPNLVVKGYTCLRVACEEGKLNIVKFLFDQKFTIFKGNTCIPSEMISSDYLLYAASSGDLATIEYFIKRGIDPNYQYPIQAQHLLLCEYQNCTVPITERPGNLTLIVTPLVIACEHGHLKATKYFIEKYNALQYTKISIIHMASALGHLHILQYLVEDLNINPDLLNVEKLTPLYRACETGHLNVVKYLILKKHCKVNFVSPEGWNGIHVASKFGKIEIVKFLKEDCNTEANDRDLRGRTPLFLASLSGQTDVVEYLAAYHWDPSYVTNDGLSCLHAATITGKIDTVKFLINNMKSNAITRTPNGSTAMHLACEHGRIEILQYLSKLKECNIDLARDDSNQSCLHAACASGNVEVVKYLVGNWSLMFDINGQDNEGVTALFLACRRKHTEIVKYLLEKTFSDPNIKTSSEQTCLHAASASGNVKLVAYLSNMFCVNTRDTEGTTPLHIACRAGHISVVQFFIDKKKNDFSIFTNNGSSYLHEACASGKVEIVKCIIDHCICHVNDKDCNGFTPLLIACQWNNLDLVKYLITKGCEKTCKTQIGWSCFHVACYYGNTDLVKFFASEYPKDDIESKDSFGNTPLYLACQEGHIEIIIYLFKQKHCDLKYQANNGWTCLHAAISTGKLELVEYISSMTKMSFLDRLLHPFHSSALNDFGSSSLLHIAAELGQLNVVQYLIKHLKYDPNSKRPDQVLPIHLASFGGHRCVVDYLVDDCMCNIQSKDIYNNTPLHFAAAGGHISMIKYLVEKYGYDINISLLKTNSEAVTFQEDFYPYYLDKVHCLDIFQEGLRNSGTTPLHCASAYGHVNALQYLIELAYCDPLIRDSNGDTILHVATRNGQLDVVKHLIENRLIEYDVEGACKVTAVHVACFNGHLDVLKYLVQDVIKDDSILIHGDEHQRTPLHYACAGGCLDVIKYIRLHVVCDTNSMLDQDGNSPLHLAAMHGKLQVVDLLMGSSVVDQKYIPRMFDLSSKNFKEKKPIDLARAEANCDVYQYFLNEETKDAAFKAPDSLSLISSLSIVVIGSCKSGKSTLIKALTSRKFDWLNFIQIAGVQPHTSRTVSHTISHKELGYITFYDMAGDEIFHAGHIVVLQQIHHPLVLVVVSLTQTAEDIGTQLAYWFKLISYAGTCSHDVFNVIIVGSHSGAPDASDKMSFINSMIKDYSDNDAYCCKGLVCCDCRYPGSESMKSLHNLIASVQNEMCDTQIKFECTEKLLCHTLFRYLQHLSRYRASITLQELISTAKTIESPNANMRMLYDINILNSTCEYLHKLGRILYFQHDNVFIEKSVIILDEDLLLKLINNYLMASLEKFKDGVVEESQLKTSICELFSPKMFDTELAIKYLLFSNFCSEITYNKLSAIKQLKADSKYYVFPELITKDISRPDDCHMWDVSGEETTLWSVWCLRCENNNFFTPELLHALFIKVINRDKDVDDLTLWSNGIALVHGNGTRSLIEVTDLTTKIYVVIQCKEKYKLQLVKQRSVFCTMIKSLVKIICCDVKYSEYILYMDRNLYPPKNFKEISISKIADALVKDVESVVLHDNSEVEVSKLLYKDFFKEAKIQDSVQVFLNRTSDKIVPEDMQHRLYDLFKDQFQTDFGDRPLSYKDLYNRAIKFSIFTDYSIFEACEVSLDSQIYEDNVNIKSSGSDSDKLSVCLEPVVQSCKLCPGWNALIECEDQVKKIIGTHLKVIAIYLRRCGIISVPLFSEITASIEDQEIKAKILYSNLLDTVKHDEESYFQFAKFLRRDSRFTETVSMLGKAYARNHGLISSEYVENVEMKTISLLYNGDSMDFIWKGYGFQLRCDEEYLPSESITIKVSTIAPKELIIPEDFEAVSGLYFIDCSYKFKKPVTVRIQHCATNLSLEHLAFATSFDNSSPYRLHCIDGNIYSNFGEVMVTSFCPLLILFRRLRGSPCYNGILYSAYLYHSDKCEQSSETLWDLYFFSVKHLEIYESVVESRAKDKQLHKSGMCIIEFNEYNEEIRFKHGRTSQNNFRIRKITSSFLSKFVIDRYTEGYPPNYKLHLIKTDAAVQKIEIKFDIKGVKGSEKYIRFVWPNPIAEVMERIPRKEVLLQHLQPAEHSCLIAENLAGWDNKISSSGASGYGSGSINQGSPETRVLDGDDQAEVEEALQFVQGRWREIGTQLHLKSSTLDMICSQNLEPVQAMGKVVSGYLSSNYNVERFGPPTWKKIVEAVEKPAGGGNVTEAERIAKNYADNVKIKSSYSRSSHLDSDKA